MNRLEQHPRNLVVKVEYTFRYIARISSLVKLTCYNQVLSYRDTSLLKYDNTSELKIYRIQIKLWAICHLI